MLYNIIIHIECLQSVVIGNVSADDFPYIMPLIDKMKYIYNGKEKSISIEIKRAGDPIDGEDI